MTAEIHALSGAYVLDAVNDVERAAFAGHVAECEACALEVAELRETAARLADNTWSVPPPRMRVEVLARVRQTRQDGPRPVVRPGRDTGAASRWRRRTVLTAAAAVLVAGAGATTYAVQDQRVRQEREATQAARAEAARISAVLSAPDAQLGSTPMPGGGRIALVWSAGDDTGVALLSDLPDPGPGRAYELWVIGDEIVSAGVLDAGQTTARRLVTGVADAAAFGVSVEPAPGGSVQPTTEAYTVQIV